MAEKFKNKRVIFPKGKQNVFLKKVKNILGISLVEMARILEINIRTLSDWQREKFCISLKAVGILSNRAGVKIPDDIKIVDEYRHVSKAAKLGGTAKYKKYGYVAENEEYRKKKWEEWWKKEGKFNKNKILERKIIRKPEKSMALAEFVGIMLGDGGISARQISITLNSETDYEYSLYVSELINSLFGIRPGIHKNKRHLAIDLVVSRTELVEFCQSIGLVIGNKIRQQIDIPSWVKDGKKFRIACVRGLIDTDGSVFTHQYRSGNKIYKYKKIDFGSASVPLCKSVYKILNDCGIKCRITTNRTVRMDSVESVKNYFEIIGTHNPKHLNRYVK